MLAPQICKNSVHIIVILLCELLFILSADVTIQWVFIDIIIDITYLQFEQIEHLLTTTTTRVLVAVFHWTWGLIYKKSLGKILSLS